MQSGFFIDQRIFNIINLSVYIRMEVVIPKYTDDEIRNMKKITCKIAGDYLGISSMTVSIGMRNNLLPIGFAIHNEELKVRCSGVRDRAGLFSR